MGTRAMKEEVSVVQRVLLVSALSGAENCAAAIMQQMGLDVEVVPGRREALDALRTGAMTRVIVEDALAEGDPGAPRCCGRWPGWPFPCR